MKLLIVKIGKFMDKWKINALAEIESHRGEYADKWVSCCGQEIGGTYIKRSGYIFKCSGCGKVHRGGLWFRTVIWGFLVNYENYSLLHKHFNRKLSFMLSKIGLI